MLNFKQFITESYSAMEEHKYNELIQAVKDDDVYKTKKYLNELESPDLDYNLLLDIAVNNDELNKELINVLMNDSRIDPNHNNSELLRQCIKRKKYSVIEYMATFDKTEVSFDNNMILKSLIDKTRIYEIPAIINNPNFKWTENLFNESEYVKFHLYSLIGDCEYDFDEDYENLDRTALAHWMKYEYFKKRLKEYCSGETTDIDLVLDELIT